MPNEREYTCPYSHCLHKGEKVKASEGVKIGTRWYHWDCATIKDQIQKCAETYIEIVDDPTRYPAAIRIIENLVFSSQVPIEFIEKNLNTNGDYYKERPLKALYGLRRLFWEFEIPRNSKVDKK